MEPTRISLRTRRSAALAVVAAAAALAIPSAAGAAVTGAVTGDTATLTGNGDNDNIVIGVTGANLSHNLTRLQQPDRLRLGDGRGSDADGGWNAHDRRRRG